MSTLAPLSSAHGPEIPTDATTRPRATARAAGEAAPPTVPATPNPSLRLDPALGLVVLEFRDQSGRTATLPTERELAAYRSAQGRPEPVPAPPGDVAPGMAQASSPGSRAGTAALPELPAAST